MHKLKIFLLIFFVVFSTQAEAYPSHGISIFGDLKYPENFKHFEYVNPNAPKGGEVKQADIGTFDNLNPLILRGVAASGLALTQDTLLAASADEPFAKYGLVAKYVDVASDRKSVTFTVDEKAKWHDGTPISVDDIIFSFETLKSKGHPFYKAYYRDVDKAEKAGKNEVRFIFLTGKNRELPLILGQMPIISKTYYSAHEFEKPSLEPPLASGPYRIEKVEPGKRIIYAKNPDYWGKDLPVNGGRYNFDRIIIDYYRDDTVAIEALKSGEYDIRQENIAKIWATSYNIPAVKNGMMKKENIRHEIPTGMQGFAFNIRKSKFSDARVREALNYTFDFEWENKYLFYDAYTRTKSYFSNSEFASNGLPSGRELELLKQFRKDLPEKLFTEEFYVPVTDGSGYPRENLEQAKQLLEEAGWFVKNKNLTNKDSGEVMKIEVLLHSSSFERAVAPMITNMKKLGIEANIRTVDSAQYQKRIEDFDFDIVLNVFGQSMSPGNEQIDYWHSSKADVKGSKNIIGIKNGVVDALVEKIVTAESKAEMIAATRALDRVLLWNYYVIPNWHLQTFRVIYWNKFGRPEIAPKYDLGFDTWWIDREKEAKLKKK